ncbi:MAG: hypothetical protein V4650_12510 [Pseudomonadota bacterium]
MKLSHKAAVIFVVFPIGPLVAVFLGSDLSPLWLSVLVAAVAAWFLAFFAIATSKLICPHCANSALFTPSGFHHPFVGSKCRYCGKPY